MKKKKVSEEAYAYTPGLKVKRDITVIKTRSLPLQGEVYVKVGDNVDWDTVVAKTHMPGEPVILQVALPLGIEPREIMDYMVKKKGDKVEESEAIATYSAFFGLLKRKVVSPIDGEIDEVSDITGQVIIRGPPIPIEVKAYIPGSVVKILQNEGAIIETNADFIQGIFGIGGENHGTIKIKKSPTEVLTLGDISVDDKGCVLIAGSFVTLNVLKKAKKVGAAGIISGGIKYTDLIKFMGRGIGVAITGEEDVSLTLIITEGFGQCTMSHRTFDILKDSEGRMASINGATQIRAGVLRPEIIIPRDGRVKKTLSEEKLESGMVPGTTVRIIRNPYFGAIGKIHSLPMELREIDTGSKVRILEVDLADGKQVVVPRANVEIIEE